MEQARATDIETAVRDYSPYGLTAAEVKSKRDKYGENNFSKGKVSGVRIFFAQFANPMSFILMAASALSIFMGEYSDALVIMVIVSLNALLSFIQEFRSGKAAEKLSRFIERKCLVIRGGEQLIVDACRLVPGDTVLLKGGDIVPADIKIMQSHNLLVNQSQLTGESVAVNKDNNSGFDILYTGSIIEKGNCQGVVFAIGNQSELGKIASLSKENKTTKYQKSLAEFSIWLLKLIGATVIFLLSVKAFTIGSTGEFAEAVLFAVALAMTSVPEALPMVTTINLSYGALRLAKKNVIVKRLSSIEDMGRIDLLCTDKTGTLTEDRLRVANIVSDNSKLFEKLAYVSMEDFELANKKHINSFDKAFLEYIPEDVKREGKGWKQVYSSPFDPALRRRHVIAEEPVTGIKYLIAVGAPETLLELSENAKDTKYLGWISNAGKKGMRQLGIAYKEVYEAAENRVFDDTAGYTFLGFANMHDPLRATAKATVKKAIEMGVNVKILSGDSPEVVAYIGREIGIIGDTSQVCTGDMLKGITGREFDTMAEEYSVFARVTPQQKYRLIKRLKKNHVVGYQGDGINDAPSLKIADVAVAVHNATDVAKDSADIVLLEDGLDVIISGIRYGRSVFVNINKYIKHAMIGNLGNFFSLIFFYLVFAADIPMLAIQLLIGNIIQDMPLMTIFSDSVDLNEVRVPQETGKIKQVIKTSINLGIFTAVYYLLFFLFVGTTATPLTQSTLFLFYNFTQLLVIVSVRSKDHFFWQGTKPSALLLSTILIFMAFSVALVYIPATAAVMGFAPLPALSFVVLSVFTVGYIFLLDITKVALNRRNRVREGIR